MANIQRKHAIAALVHLKQIGMSEDDITKLVKLVGIWQTSVGQGNGGNNITGNLELDDRLNLPNNPQ